MPSLVFKSDLSLLRVLRAPQGGVRPRRAREIPVLPLTNVYKLEFCYSVTGPMHLFKSDLSLFRRDSRRAPPPPQAQGAMDSPIKKMNT